VKRLAAVALLLLAAAALAGVARPDGSHAAGSPAAADTPRTITVSGSGTATSIPTKASISFGVQTQDPSAKAALAQNARDMQQVIDALKKAGAQDITTQSVSLSPTYGDNSLLTGYTASNTVSATVTFGAAGATIDAAVGAGANQVYGPSPLLADLEAQYQKALADAVANARARGDVLAKAAGQTLGAVASIVEGGNSVVPLQYAKAASVDSATPVVAGPQDTTASVTVTFELG
jgi:uncharacterized protein YggE